MKQYDIEFIRYLYFTEKIKFELTDLSPELAMEVEDFRTNKYITERSMFVSNNMQTYYGFSTLTGCLVYTKAVSIIPV